MASSKKKTLTLLGVTNLASPKINGESISVEWKNRKEDRSGIRVKWTLEKAGADKERTEKAATKNATKDSTNIFRKSNWYPYEGKPKLRAIQAEVWYVPTAESGKEYSSVVSKHAESSREVYPPYAPKVGALSYNHETGRVACTVSDSTADTSAHMRTWTKWKRIIERNFGTKSQTATGTFTGSSSTAAGIDLSDSRSLKHGQYIKVTVEAWNRGAAGTSEKASRSYVIAHPAIPKIVSVKYDGKGDNRIVIVRINTMKGALYPTEQVQLQRITDVDAGATAAQVEKMTGWEDVDGAVDNGDCTGLVDSAVEATSAAGKYTWFRVKATARGYTQYSGVYKAADLFVPEKTAVVRKAEIISVDDMEDGNSVKVTVGSKSESSVAFQIGWGEESTARWANSGFNTMNIDWKASAPASGYASSAAAYVTGLEEGKPYYFRARTLHDSEEGIKDVWSDSVKGVATSTPKSVNLVAPAYVLEGKGIGIEWNFDSASAQRQYKVFVNGNSRLSKNSTSQYCVIPADMISGDSVTLQVGVSTGGDFGYSEEVRVDVYKQPAITYADAFPTVGTADDPTWYAEQAAGILQGEKLVGENKGFAAKFTVSGEDDCDMVWKIVSEGANCSMPDGAKVQAAGDVVAFGREDITALAVDNGYRVLQVPANIDLLDRCRYSLELQAVSNTTGLRSSIAAIPLVVIFSHQAEEQAAAVTVNEDGSVSITPASVEFVREGDMCDIYRVSLERAYRIAKDVAYGATVTDSYPPFNAEGEPLSYRVMQRTSDGDVSWWEEEFENYGSICRIDWNGANGAEFLEVEYGIEFTPALVKDFEARSHIDGSLSGYWGKSVDMTVPVSTSLLRRDMDAQRSLMSLASHSGSCFVRLPNGMAFPADVQVSGATFEADSSFVGVSLNITRVQMTEEWEAR